MAERPRAKAGGGVTMAPGSGRGKSIALLAAAVSLVCIALLVLFGRPPAPAPPPEARAPLASAAADAPAPDAAPRGAPAGAPAVSAPAPAPEPPAREPAAGAGAAPPEPEAEAGAVLPSGIGLFPPPGTDPVKVGLVVPDDFELPEGYLRHHQTTDDGQDVPPILLFHPDYELLDDAGQPIPLPADRVVPVELAPPGLPIETVVLPEPRQE